jgi:phage/plasmid-like protein (TIGR03299 family)
VAHMIESNFYAGERPWHGLGVPVVTEQTSENAIVLAGLDWTVSTQPVVSKVGGSDVAIPDYRAVVRDTDKSVLGVVGTRYRPIQNKDAFSFFDEVVGGKQAIYHTAGSLDGGRRIWLLAKLPGEIIIPGKKDENIEKFLLLTNSHDGTSAARMFFTPTRVVCQNTLTMALRGFNANEGISIRHTANATSRIEEAKRALGLAVEYYDGFEKKVHNLIDAKFSQKQMEKLTEVLFPAANDDVPTRTQNTRATVLDLFDFGMGHKDIRGTAWAAYNAVAEFTDHHRSTRTDGSTTEQESRMSAIWFGTGRTLKAKAFSHIADTVGLAA